MRSYLIYSPPFVVKSCVFFSLYDIQTTLLKFFFSISVRIRGQKTPVPVPAIQIGPNPTKEGNCGRQEYGLQSCTSRPSSAQHAHMACWHIYIYVIGWIILEF